MTSAELNALADGGNKPMDSTPNPSGWRKNLAGVKDGTECYRTIGGVKWSWYAEDAAIFKGTGIRHRKAPGGQGTFIHPNDDEAASTIVGYEHE